MAAGYIFGILAHYRFFFGTRRKGRENPEPFDRVLVLAAIAAALLAFGKVGATPVVIKVCTNNPSGNIANTGFEES